MAEYKLLYFNMYGRGEASRIMFNLAGVDFEDIRIGPKQWTEIKPTTPLGFMPVLESPEGKISQTTSVHMYVAGKTGFLPEGLYNRMQAISILITMNEYGVEISKLVLLSEVHKMMPTPENIEEKKAAAIALINKLHAFIESLAVKGAKFTFGDKMTVVDFSLFTNMQSYFVVFAEETFTNEWYTKFMTNMRADEKLAKYLAGRPPSKIGL